MSIDINPALDRDALAAAYAKKNRLQVRNFLTTDSAERIYDCLVRETPWGLVYNRVEDGKETVFEIPNHKYKNMKPEEIKAVYAEAYARAANTYQFVYHCYPILTSYLAGEHRDFLLHRVLEFLNAEPMLDFIRKLTGFTDVIKADAQATLYRGNNFLHWHDDEVKEQGWRCAYVLNLTRGWHPNWGGYLQFFDADGNVEAALRPAYNVLNVFSVPMRHSVGFIPPYCQGQRLSITGWFRNK